MQSICKQRVRSCRAVQGFPGLVEQIVLLIWRLFPCIPLTPKGSSGRPQKEHYVSCGQTGGKSPTREEDGEGKHTCRTEMSMTTPFHGSLFQVHHGRVWQAECHGAENSGLQSLFPLVTFFTYMGFCSSWVL